MQTVRTDDGTRYLLLKRSGDSSLVRDPTTGEEQYIENACLESADVSSLETAASAIPDSVRRVVRAASDDRALGLLLVLDRRGPTAVSDLMALTDLCESDFNGLLSEFRAAGLVESVSIGGIPGYETSDQASTGLSKLRE